MKRLTDIPRDTLLTGMLALMTGGVVRYIIHQSAIPVHGVTRVSLIVTFPIALIAFHCLTVFSAAPGRRRRARRWDRWSTLSVLPLFLILLTWDNWESGLIVVNLFHWGYIVTRLAGYQLFRQTRTRPVPLDAIDWIALSVAAYLLAMVHLHGGLAAIAGRVISSMMTAFLVLWIVRIVELHASVGFPGTVRQRILSSLILLTPPVAMLQEKPMDWFIPAMGAAAVLALRVRSDRKVRYLIYLIGGTAVFLAPIIDPGLMVFSIWMTIVVSADDGTRRTDNTSMLVTGGFAVLCIAGILVAYLRTRGLFPTGDLIYPFPGPAVWLGALIDRQSGFLPAAPWLICAIAGWFVCIRSPRRVEGLIWLGWPLVLAGLVISTGLARGMPPGPTTILPVMVMLMPYIGAMLPDAFNGWTAALFRALAGLSLVITAMLWSLEGSGFLSITVMDLADVLTRQSDLEWSSLLPALTHMSPVITPVAVFWSGLFLGIAGVVIPLARWLDRIRPGASMYPDAIVLTLVLAGFAGGLHAARIWYRIPLSEPIQLEPGQSRAIAIATGHTVRAVELETRMSRSAHIQQNTPVSAVTLAHGAGLMTRLMLEAGVDTAEWAYDRPDVLRSVRHDRPEIASTWIVEELNGFRYPGHTYRSLLFPDYPDVMTELAIQNVTSRDNGPLLTLDGIRLMIDSGEKPASPPYTINLQSVELDRQSRTWSKPFSGIHAYRGILVDSALAHAARVKTGDVIGQITIYNRDGTSAFHLVRAGIDTAEWAIDRPDMIGHVLHSAASPAVSRRQMHGADPYLAHVFRGVWSWKPGTPVTRIELECLPGPDSESMHWMIDRIVLY
ncbi:hypothetical protein JXA80_12905 [bacterium]|nr:hypothetical protein [candidate division CSSED10-310 bacterium]